MLTNVNKHKKIWLSATNPIYGCREYIKPIWSSYRLYEGRSDMVNVVLTFKAAGEHIINDICLPSFYPLDTKFRELRR